MIRNDNARCRNTRKSSMYVEKILGIVNARWKNARNCYYKVQEWSESTMCAEKCSKSTMQGARMLGIVNARCKNTRNRQCKMQEWLETAIQGARILRIVNARCKNARNRQCTQKKYSDSTMYTEKCSESVIICAERTLGNNNTCKRMPGNDNVYRKKTRNRQCKEFSLVSFVGEFS